MKIVIYNPEYKDIWDNFVSDSKNGTFLFYRDFIEYHGKRFNDYSLLFYLENKLIGLMPAHIEDNIFYTHRGLTYGGLIMSPKTSMEHTMIIFEYLTITLRNQGIKQIVYKAIPHIYHAMPAEEDLYALFRNNAILSARSISSTIMLENKMKFSEIRRRGIKRAEKDNLKVEKSDNVAAFWDILSLNLHQKYQTQAVHTLEEIAYLKNKFENNIHLFTATDRLEKVLGGCLIFEMKNIVHVQYIAATDDGKKAGAIDLIIDYLINKEYSHKTYFDYGTSTEKNGQYLNTNLIHQKEGFGARGIAYDIYTIDL